jgi:hypothetical protein
MPILELIGFKSYGTPKVTFFTRFSLDLIRFYEILISFYELLIRYYEILIPFTNY